MLVLPQGAMKVARQFARAVIKRRWMELSPLFAASAVAANTPESLEAAFGWAHLGPRLRQMHIDMTGEPEDLVPELDPPRRFEVFEVGNDYRGEPLRQPPAGHDPSIPVGWVQVDFLPSEDSGFDQCYNCLLAFIDEAGPRITTYVIESATE